MRLVALFSGGKDSVLSVLLARAHGHEVCALLNVYPADRAVDGEDLDSHCFQTVGSGNVESLAAALGIPLRRRPIAKGQSVHTELVYDNHHQNNKDRVAVVDEVEVLYELVKDAVAEFSVPGSPVQGVCSGAILSDYQRLRVEHICTRLNLFSYAYLWRMEAEGVLRLAATLRVDAILLKVASMGLTPRKHLGKPLSVLTPYLLSLAPHVHPAGEGGEFETLVVSCPIGDNRLTIPSSKIVVVDDNPITPTGHVVVDTAVTPKTAEELELDRAVVAQLLDGGRAAYALAAGLRGEDTEFAVEVAIAERRAARFPLAATLELSSLPPPPTVVPTPEGMMARPSLDASRYGAFPALYHRTSDHGGTAAEQVRAIFSNLTPEIRSQIFYTMVFLPSLADFAAINSVYVEFFGVSPPSRAVVELCSLPSVAIDVYLVPEGDTRDVLHVQSISCWAAACIGPYAQANTLKQRGLVATAGMLGLEPGSMCLSGLPGSRGPVASPTALDQLAHQFKVCVENLNATLRRVASSLASITHAQIFVTDTAHASLVPGLWRWVTDNSELPKYCRVVVVSRLPKDAAVEIMVTSRVATTTVNEDGEVDQQGLPEGWLNPFWERPGLKIADV